MKRAKRRASERKVKAKAKRFILDVWNSPKLANDPKFVGKLAATPKPCSGMCCGNPRRHYKGKGKLTMQELKQDNIVSENCECEEIDGGLFMGENGIPHHPSCPMSKK